MMNARTRGALRGALRVLYRVYCAYIGAKLARPRGARAMLYAATEEFIIGIDDLGSPHTGQYNKTERAFSRIHTRLK
jgi:hypothetical protein